MAYTNPPDLVLGDVVTTTLVNGLSGNDTANWTLLHYDGISVGEHWNTGGHNAVRVPRAMLSCFYDYAATEYRIISSLNVTSVARAAAGSINVELADTPAAISLFVSASNYGAIISPDMPSVVGVLASRTDGNTCQIQLLDIAGNGRDGGFSAIFFGARR